MSVRESSRRRSRRFRPCRRRRNVCGASGRSIEKWSRVGLAWSHESALIGGDDCLCSVAYVELGEDAAHVGSHGGLAEEECGGDLGVAESACDEFEDVEFAFAELGDRMLRCCSGARATYELVDHLPQDLRW